VVLTSRVALGDRGDELLFHCLAVHTLCVSFLSFLSFCILMRGRVLLSFGCIVVISPHLYGIMVLIWMGYWDRNRKASTYFRFWLGRLFIYPLFSTVVTYASKKCIIVVV
jgi:hypothetical protein